MTGYPPPVVTWRKLSSQLPLDRVRYNNSALQISQVRKEDSDTYTCSARNLLGKAEKNTMLVVVSLPRFTSKPPFKIVSIIGFAERLNCSAVGDPQPIISWRKHGGQLPVGRSREINGALVITNLQQCWCVRCGSCNHFGNSKRWAGDFGESMCHQTMTIKI